MSARYTLDKATRDRESQDVVRWDHGTIAGSVIVETYTITDTRNGQRYDRGGYRVVVSGPDDRTPRRPRTRTFYGETAWSRAENLRRDAVYWLQRRVAGLL